MEKVIKTLMNMVIDSIILKGKGKEKERKGKMMTLMNIVQFLSAQFQLVHKVSMKNKDFQNIRENKMNLTIIISILREKISKKLKIGTLKIPLRIKV